MGDGFLQVTLPNGDTRYTRDGALQQNADGQLVNTTGYTIEPAITIPSDAIADDIGKDGSVSEGPPPRPLDRYEVKVEEDTIYILGG